MSQIDTSYFLWKMGNATGTSLLNEFKAKIVALHHANQLPSTFDKNEALAYFMETKLRGGNTPTTTIIDNHLRYLNIYEDLFDFVNKM